MNETPKKKRRGLLILLFLMAFIVFLVLALPWILSTSVVRNRVVDAVNSAGDVTIGVSNWSLGWGGEQQVEGFSLETADGLTVNLPRISVSRGLLGILRSRDAGVITLDQPRIVVPAPKNPTPPTPTGTPPAPAPAKPAKPAAPSKPVSFPAIPVTGTLKILGGSLALSSGQGITPVLEQIASVIELPAALEKLTIDFKAMAPGGGDLALNGHVGLPGSGSRDMAKLPVKINLAVHHFQFAPYLEWASGLKAVPKGEGVIDLQLQADGSIGTGFTLVGALTGSNIKLSGGALGKDEPAFDKITVDLDGSIIPSGISFRKLEVLSPVLQVNASGQVDESGDGNFVIKAEMPLAEVFSRFPHTLKLREGMAVTGGLVTVDAGITTTAQQQQVNGTVKLEGLQGVMDGKAVALSEPVNAMLKGEKGPAGIRLKQLDVSSNFLRGQGSGTPEDFELKLNADLPAAMAEAEKFIDLAPWSATGHADLAVSLKDRNDNRRDLTGILILTNFSLKNGTTVLVPEQLIQANLRAETDTPADAFLKQIHQGQLILQSGFGNGRVTLSNLVLPDGDGLPTIEKIKLGAQLNLDQLNPLLNPPGEPAMALKGRAMVAGDLALANQVLSFNDLEVTMENFQALLAAQQITLPAVIKTSGSFNLDPKQQVLTLQALELSSEVLSIQAGEKITQLKNLSVSTAGKVDLTNRSLRLTPTRVQSQALTVNTGALEIPDWSNPLDVRGSAKLESTLETLLELSQTAGVSARGRVRADVNLSGVQADGQTIAFTSTIEDLEYVVSEKETIRDKQVTLSGKLVVDEKNKNLSFPELILQSTPLNFSAMGHLNQYDSAKNLETRGNLAVDLDQLAPYLRPVIDEGLVMKGRTDRPFEAVLSLGADAPAQSARGFASLHADELSVFGLDFRGLDLPMSISNNVARVALTATANEGKVVVRPGIDFGAEIKSLSIPKDSLVLDRVKLTSQLADALLGRIHPLFKGASVVGGQVSMTLDYFDMPLGAGKENEMKFAGTLHLHEVKLGASGMLEGVLNAITAKE